MREYVNKLVRDTLMIKKGNEYVWSRTSLTMFSAWIVVLWAFHYDLIKNGFNQHSFDALVVVALGSKITDSWSKKLNPEPKNDTPPV